MTRTPFVATVILLVALALGCGRDEAKVAVGLAIGSYVHAVAWVGAESGAFSRAGIAVDVTVMGGSSDAIRALLAEQIDVGLAGGDTVLNANAAGADLVVIGGLVDRFYHRIVAREGVDDLRGKKIGLPFLGGPQHMAVKVALDKLGLDHDRDVEVVSLGKEFNRMAALQNRELDASTSESPDSVLRKLGLHVVVDLPAEPIAFPYMVVVVRRAWLAQHGSQAQAIVRGLCEATRYYADERDASLQIIGTHLGKAGVDDEARERYEAGGPSFLAYPPRANAASLRSALALMDKVDAVDVDAMIDDSVLEAVLAEGHCQ